MADYERIHIAPSIHEPGAWIVEAYDHDGGIEQAIFIGPRAQERAETWARFRYQFSGAADRESSITPNLTERVNGR